MLLASGCAQGEPPLIDAHPSADPAGTRCGTATSTAGASHELPDGGSRIVREQGHSRILATSQVSLGAPDPSVLVANDGSSLEEIDPTTGGRTTIAQVRGPSAPFAVSPDGNWIAVAQSLGVLLSSPFATELDLISRDGSLIRHVHSATESVSALSWSPDSRYLAFIADQHLRRADVTDLSEIEIVGAPSPSFARGYHRSAWSSDGEWILFTGGAYSTIERVSPDGTGLRVFSAGKEFAFSPDGSEVAIAHYEGISIARTDGSDLTDLVAGLGGPMSWSPDGRAIAFVTVEDGTMLCLISADGSLRALGPCVAIDSPAPAWSPDGMRIAFLEMLSDETCRQTADVRLSVIEISSGAITPLSEGWLLDPVWVP
jgi:Tol biopolymer transport system component